MGYLVPNGHRRCHVRMACTKKLRQHVKPTPWARITGLGVTGALFGDLPLAVPAQEALPGRSDPPTLPRSRATIVGPDHRIGARLAITSFATLLYRS